MFFYPTLRTLQMASVLWTTHIAVGVACVVSGKHILCIGFFPAVSFAAVLLCSYHWAAGLMQAFVPAKPGTEYPCISTWQIHPDAVWTVEVGMLLLVIVGAYINTIWRICRLSTAAVVSAKLYRVLIYVAVFGVCYAPYVLLQGLHRSVYLAELVGKSPSYQIIYCMYLLTGFCNVAAYGIHHWDASCWRRRRLHLCGTGNEMRVVMFLPSRPQERAYSCDSQNSASNPSTPNASCSATHDCSVAFNEVESEILTMSSIRSELQTPLPQAQDQVVVNAAKAYGCL